MDSIFTANLNAKEALYLLSLLPKSFSLSLFKTSASNHQPSNLNPQQSRLSRKQRQITSQEHLFQFSVPVAHTPNPHSSKNEGEQYGSQLKMKGGSETRGKTNPMVSFAQKERWRRHSYNTRPKTKLGNDSIKQTQRGNEEQVGENEAEDRSDGKNLLYFLNQLQSHKNVNLFTHIQVDTNHNRRSSARTYSDMDFKNIAEKITRNEYPSFLALTHEIKKIIKQHYSLHQIGSPVYQKIRDFEIYFQNLSKKYPPSHQELSHYQTNYPVRSTTEKTKESMSLAMEGQKTIETETGCKPTLTTGHSLLAQQSREPQEAKPEEVVSLPLIKAGGLLIEITPNERETRRGTIEMSVWQREQLFDRIAQLPQESLEELVTILGKKNEKQSVLELKEITNETLEQIMNIVRQQR